MIDLTDYRRLTGDPLVNDAAITLYRAVATRVAEALTATGAPGALTIAYPGEIRALSLRIFDRTFAVTYLLEAVAVLIGWRAWRPVSPHWRRRDDRSSACSATSA